MIFGRATSLATLFYVAATLALTYPLVRQITTAVPSDPGDPLLTTWMLWWNAHTIPFSAAWWNAPSFFPSPDSLALSEHLFGLSLVSTPVIWLTGNAQLAHNVAFLSTFVLSALGAYALGFTLTKRADAAFVAGLAYGFAPYRAAQFPHIQTLASFWMPFALVGLHKYLEERRARWLVLFGAATLLQSLSNNYYLMFFPVLVGLWIIWFLPFGQRIASLAAIGGTLVLAHLPLIPILLHYRRVHERLGLSRTLDEAAFFSADMTALVHAAPGLALWGEWLPEPSPEAQLFPGLTIVLIIVVALIVRRRHATPPATIRQPRGRAERIALAVAVAAAVASALALSAIVSPWRARAAGISISVTHVTNPAVAALILWAIFGLLHSSRRSGTWQSPLPLLHHTVLKWQSPLAFYITATVVMWFLCFGPRLRFRGRELDVTAPYSLLALLPGYDGLRVPARFAMLAALCLAAAASVALARILVRLPRRGQAALTAAAAIGVLADGWIGQMPLAEAPRASVLTVNDAPGAVLELPVVDLFGDVAAMYRGIAHRHPVVNGFSGYTPPHYAVLRAALGAADPSVLGVLSSLGVRHVVVVAEADLDGRHQKYVRAHPGAALVRDANGQAHYALVPEQGAAATLRVGSAVPIARLMAASAPHDVDAMLDGELETAWSVGQPQSGGDAEVLTVDLGTAHAVAGVELALGSFPGDYPRELGVEWSLDGERWVNAWRGPTGGRTLLAALEDPRRVPLRVQFEPAWTRYIRLRQLGADPVSGWSTAELVVLAPADPWR